MRRQFAHARTSHKSTGRASRGGRQPVQGVGQRPCRRIADSAGPVSPDDEDGRCLARRLGGRRKHAHRGPGRLAVGVDVPRRVGGVRSRTPAMSLPQRDGYRLRKPGRGNCIGSIRSAIRSRRQRTDSSRNDASTSRRPEIPSILDAFPARIWPARPRPSQRTGFWGTLEGARKRVR